MIKQRARNAAVKLWRMASEKFLRMFRWKVR